MEIPTRDELKRFDALSAIPQFASRFYSAIRDAADKSSISDIIGMVLQLKDELHNEIFNWKDTNDSSYDAEDNEQDQIDPDNNRYQAQSSEQYWKVSEVHRESRYLQYEMDTIPDIISQLKASANASRQKVNSNSESAFKNAFWQSMFPDSFYDRLFDIACEYDCSRFQCNDSSQWKANVKVFIEDNVMLSPVASMLLPVLLTVCITDNTFAKSDVELRQLNVYTLLKYKSSARDARRKEERIVHLFRQIHTLVGKFTEKVQYPVSKFPLTLPVFHWDEITHMFKSLFAPEIEQMSQEDIQSLRRDYERLRGTNGGSFNHISEIKHDKTVSLRKRVAEGMRLLNASLLIKLKCGLTLPQSDKNLLQNFFPDCKEKYTTFLLVAKATDGLNYQLYNLCFSIFYHERDLNPLMLFYIYHLPNEYNDKILSYGAASFSDFVNCFSEEIACFLQRKYTLSYWNFISKFAGDYSAKNIIVAKEISTKIAKNFTLDDYNCFISEPSNFTWSGFFGFYSNFCEKYSIDAQDAIPEIVYDAYSTVIWLCKSFCAEDIKHFRVYPPIDDLYKKSSR